MGDAKNSYAGFWLRFLAAIIDDVVITIIGAVTGIILAIVIKSGASAEIADEISDWTYILIFWLYFAAMESSPRQATLGKMAVGIKVTDLREEKISFLKATGRNFGKILSLLPLMLGFIMIAFTKRKQGLHDILARCLVIRN